MMIKLKTSIHLCDKLSVLLKSLIKSQFLKKKWKQKLNKVKMNKLII